jgi:hypothetical protein
MFSTPFKLVLSLGLYLLWLGLTWLFFRESDNAFPRVGHEFYMWGLSLGLLGGYGLGYQGLKQWLSNTETPLKPAHWGWVLGGFAVFSWFALYTQPFQSTDIYGYINRGWQQFHYATNPYVTTIDGISGWGEDPMFRNHWVNNPIPYGFLFAHITRFICYLGEGDWHQTLLAFKWLSWFALAGCAVLVNHALKCLKRSPHERILAAYLLLWNPLIVMHQLVNGHNDILMGFFTTLASVFVISGQALWILPSLIAAGFIKYLPFMLLPFGALWIWHQAQEKTIYYKFGLLGLALGVSVLIAYPYVLDFDAFRFGDIGGNATVTHNSLAALIHHGYKNILSKLLPFLKVTVSPINTMVKVLLWGGFFTLYVKLLWQWLKPTPSEKEKRVPNQAKWIFQIVLLQFVLVCWVSSKFYAWYLGMFFPMAFLLPQGHPLRKMIIAVSCAQMLSITFLGQAHMANFILMTLLPCLYFALPEWVAWQRKKQFQQNVSAHSITHQTSLA